MCVRLAFGWTCKADCRMETRTSLEGGGGRGISAKYCTGRRFVHWGIVRGGGVLAEVLLYWPGGGTEL